MAHLGERVTSGNSLSEEGSEVFSRDTMQLRHQQQSLRPDEIWWRITTAVAAPVRASHMLEHSVIQIKSLFLINQNRCIIAVLTRHFFFNNWNRYSRRQRSNSIKISASFDWFQDYLARSIDRIRWFDQIDSIGPIHQKEMIVIRWILTLNQFLLTGWPRVTHSSFQSIQNCEIVRIISTNSLLMNRWNNQYKQYVTF